jgi:pyrimidine operon attenuation protein/uracil phosphoribosyltransferase
MLPERVKILDQSSVEAVLRRMAFQMYEKNYHAKGLVIVGVDQRGAYLASLLEAYLQEISDLETELYAVTIDRHPDSKVLGITLDGDLEGLTGKAVVLVDDVLYTGITLLNVVAIVLQSEPAIIQVAALIDRGHRMVPISPDFVGKELATTLHQRVTVVVDEPTASVEVFLS